LRSGEAAAADTAEGDAEAAAAFEAAALEVAEAAALEVAEAAPLEGAEAVALAGEAAAVVAAAASRFGAGAAACRGEAAPSARLERLAVTLTDAGRQVGLDERFDPANDLVPSASQVMRASGARRAAVGRESIEKRRPRNAPARV
jgi:hypothetical protein